MVGGAVGASHSLSTRLLLFNCAGGDRRGAGPRPFNLDPGESAFYMYVVSAFIRGCEEIAVVQAFRPAVSGGPEGPHYIRSDFFTRSAVTVGDGLQTVPEVAAPANRR